MSPTTKSSLSVSITSPTASLIMGPSFSICPGAIIAFAKGSNVKNLFCITVPPLMLVVINSKCSNPIFATDNF